MSSISTLSQSLLFKSKRNSPPPRLYKSLHQPEFGFLLHRKPSFLKSRSMIKTRSFKESSSNEIENDCVQVLEQEALIDGGVHVEGFKATLNRLSKWLVAALFGGVILWRHDAEAIWMAMGSIVNAILSNVLKRLLNQDRPVAGLKSDPGMPSSHAQSIFFTVVFTIASILEWIGVNGVSVSISILALAFGSYLSWLRVSQKLHTMNQILVGGVVGSIFSVLWYMSWNAVVLEAFNSSFSVRIVVLLACAGLGLGFLVYVIQYWLKDER